MEQEEQVGDDLSEKVLPMEEALPEQEEALPALPQF
jgi:hypothetical protein